jgi:hypothetical protein
MARAVHPTGGPFIRHQPPAGAGRRRNHIGPDSGGRPLTTKLLTRQDTPPAVSRPRPAQPESGAEHWRFRRAYCGRAFGYIAYPPRPDGEPTFNERCVFDGTTSSGGLLPARVVEAPWLTRLQTVGEDVSLVLETPSGTVHIAGETILSTHDIYHDDTMFSSQALKQEMPSFPALHRAGVRYRWDGEETFGMLERSNPLDKIS